MQNEHQGAVPACVIAEFVPWAVVSTADEPLGVFISLIPFNFFSAPAELSPQDCTVRGCRHKHNTAISQ